MRAVEIVEGRVWMKKKFLLFIAAMLVCATAAQADGTVTETSAEEKPLIIVTRKLDILINGEWIDIESFLDENGRTLVPVRKICEILNYRVDWFDSPRRVAVSKVPAVDNESRGGAGGDSLWFIMGERRYRVNGNYYDMDTAAQLIDGCAYVPLRILAEFLGYDVVYSPTSSS